MLVVRIEEKEKKTGLIIIPDTAKEKPQEAEVIAVGPGKMDKNGKRMSISIREGDRILLGRYAGHEIEIDGVEHVIINEDDIPGVIEK